MRDREENKNMKKRKKDNHDKIKGKETLRKKVSERVRRRESFQKNGKSVALKNKTKDIYSFKKIETYVAKRQDGLERERKMSE